MALCPFLSSQYQGTLWQFPRFQQAEQDYLSPVCALIARFVPNPYKDLLGLTKFTFIC